MKAGSKTINLSPNSGYSQIKIKSDLCLEISQKWCRDAELNCGHEDFQSSALPTELSRQHKQIVR